MTSTGREISKRCEGKRRVLRPRLDKQRTHEVLGAGVLQNCPNSVHHPQKAPVAPDGLLDQRPSDSPDEPMGGDTGATAPAAHQSAPALSSEMCISPARLMFSTQNAAFDVAVGGTMNHLTQGGSQKSSESEHDHLPKPEAMSQSETSGDRLTGREEPVRSSRHYLAACEKRVEAFVAGEILMSLNEGTSVDDALVALSSAYFVAVWMWLSPARM